MAWSGKIANRGWKAGFWRARKILEALARDGGQKLAAWFRKADEDQSAALKLGRKAASGALGVLALTGKTCWALALAGDKAWALARGGISWDEHFELLREAEGIPLSREARALKKSISRAGRSRVGRKQLGKILTATVKEPNLNLSLMKDLVDAGARLDQKWDGLGGA